jgi:hypothetical protein
MVCLPPRLCGLVDGAYLVCLLAEFLLWLLERKSSAGRGSACIRKSERDGRARERKCPLPPSATRAQTIEQTLQGWKKGRD